MKHLAIASIVVASTLLASSGQAGTLDVGSSILVGGLDGEIAFEVEPAAQQPTVSEISSDQTRSPVKARPPDPPAPQLPPLPPLDKHQAAPPTTTPSPKVSVESQRPERSQKKQSLFQKLFPRENKKSWMMKTFGHR